MLKFVLAAASLLGPPLAAGLPGEPAEAAQANAEPGGRTLEVGQGKPLATLADAAKAARDGDTIVLAPGQYRECAIWGRNNLTIRAAKPGKTEILDVTCKGKAIFIVKGDNMTVDGLIFRGAYANDGNGAGIRLEAPLLTVRNSTFTDSQQGILGGKAGGVVTIEKSLFERVGNCKNSGGCAHGVYLGQIDKLTIRDSVFRDIRQGHAIKTGAKELVITGTRTEDGDTGTSSYSVDFSFGGTLRLENNVFQKGPNASNRGAMVMIAAGGGKNAPSHMIIRNNRFINANEKLTTAVINRTSYPLTMADNRFEGRITPASGRTAK